jgi:hypothetical protein
MVAKLVLVKQERNTTIVKVIEKEGAMGCLSEQLQSECRTLVLSSSSRAHHDFSSLFIFQKFRPNWSNLKHPGSKTLPP